MIPVWLLPLFLLRSAIVANPIAYLRLQQPFRSRHSGHLRIYKAEIELLDYGCDVDRTSVRINVSPLPMIHISGDFHDNGNFLPEVQPSRHRLIFHVSSSRFIAYSLLLFRNALSSVITLNSTSRILLDTTVCECNIFCAHHTVGPTLNHCSLRWANFFNTQIHTAFTYIITLGFLIYILGVEYISL